MCRGHDLTQLSWRVCPSGETMSEGGFAPGRVSAASLLGVSEGTDKKGKKYYRYEFLTRSGAPAGQPGGWGGGRGVSNQVLRHVLQGPTWPCVTPHTPQQLMEVAVVCSLSAC
jgi:hypothetical protein